MDSLLRHRLRLLREERGLSQEQMTQQMGLKDRQALSQIENGAREMSAEELGKAAAALGVSVFTLSDPFQLVGEGAFSWRQKNVSDQDLRAFEATAGKWIAAFRHLNQLKGDPVKSGLRRVGLSIHSNLDEAQQEGEDFAQLLELGPIPAERLTEVLQEKLDTLVLYINAPVGISGAACQVGALNTILVNRNEPAGRRNYDLAHEFFHLLTWDVMPPNRIDSQTGVKIEKLADNFAAGLLMPWQTIQGIVAHNPIPPEAQLHQWIKVAASSMLVSPTAMLWRLVHTGHVKRAVAERVRAQGEWWEANATGMELPRRFSPKLMGILAWAIECGQLSARRAAALLDTNLGELTSLFAEHQMPCPYEL